MSNKINTTQGNEVKDMNTVQLEGKASSSTSKSGGMSNGAKVLILAIINLLVGLSLCIGYSLVGSGITEPVTKDGILEAMVAGLAIFLMAVGIASVNKLKKMSETSSEEQPAEVTEAKVTSAEDKKPSNGMSNATKFLVIALGVIAVAALLGAGFGILMM